MKKMLRKIDPKNAANFKQAYKKFSRDKRSSLFYLFISDEKHYKIGINCFNIWVCLFLIFNLAGKLIRINHGSLFNLINSYKLNVIQICRSKMQQILNKPIKIFPGTNTVAYFTSL